VSLQEKQTKASRDEDSMSKIDRRMFIKQAAVGSAALALGRLMAAETTSLPFLGPTSLGKSGVKVTRLAMGTGTDGWEKSSAQVRLGKDRFIALARHAYEQGIRFFEGADIYGSHEFMRAALQEMPREQVTVMSKIWNRDEDWLPFKGIEQTVDRFRKELNSDYLDIALLHCMTDGDWQTTYQKHCETLSELKQKGIVRACGISCHDLGALKAAADSDWVDVILARINAYGKHMDASPAEIMQVLQRAHERGIGVLGMKIYGCGEAASPSQRQKSLELVWNSGNVDAVTIGFTRPEQIDDTLTRMQAIFAEKESGRG
jgi:1-deoxyxylulose-5-phosphate synthase